jgi:hypothetical protein
MINFGLYINALTNGSQYFRAIVMPKQTLDLDKVIDHMLIRRSTLTRQDIMAVLDLFFATLFDLILEGFNIVTPLVNFGVSIKGNFESSSDAYDSSRHSAEPKVNVNARFKKQFKAQVQVHQQQANRPMPQPTDYINPNNGYDHDTLTPGGGAKLSGYELQFDAEDPQQGIFLIAGDRSETRVEVVLLNTARELIFLVPNTLATGDYTLQVRARYGNDNIRAGVLERPLTVA